MHFKYNNFFEDLINIEFWKFQIFTPKFSINLETSNPSYSITKEDLDKSGTFRLEDYLSKLPQIAPGNSALQSGFSTGTASVSLRSLGGDRTLLLIDGKRLSPGTPFDGHAEADINQIPDALVKRIDVVTGGKSTIYGSDAIGGVINFILDRSFEGIKVDFQSISEANHFFSNSEKELTKSLDKYIKKETALY